VRVFRHHRASTNGDPGGGESDALSHRDEVVRTGEDAHRKPSESLGNLKRTGVDVEPWSYRPKRCARGSS
jgi:hypothetical protein